MCLNHPNHPWNLNSHLYVHGFHRKNTFYNVNYGNHWFYHRKQLLICFLVGGLNPSEKYESQLG